MTHSPPLHTAPYVSLCQRRITVYTICSASSLYITTTFLLSLSPLYSPLLSFFLPPLHPQPLFHLYILTINSRLSTLVLTLKRSQSEGCVILKCVPVKVFIEMGLYRDWSCLLSHRIVTASQSRFPLSGDALSRTQCILFHGGLVILQRCAIIGICRGAQCVCVYVRV